MSDSSAIDNALIAMLGADSTLMGYMPNGVYYEEAPPGSTRFVIVKLMDEFDEAQFGGRAYEDALYLVKAVARSSANADLRSAAARIDAVLEDQPIGVGSPPVVDGYTWMTCHRESRIRITEPDGSDASVRWHHRGGLYRVQMSVNPAGSP
jgi:hypothetical protein